MVRSHPKSWAVDSIHSQEYGPESSFPSPWIRLIELAPYDISVPRPLAVGTFVGGYTSLSLSLSLYIYIYAHVRVCVRVCVRSFACTSRGLEREPFCSQTPDWPFKSFLGCQGGAAVKSSDVCERVSSWVLLLTRFVDRMTCCLWLVLWHDVILVEGTGILYTARHY